MPTPVSCPDCHETFLNSLPKCPHCGRPSRFPNVDQAQEGAQALAARHQAALRDAQSRGAEARLLKFEDYAKNSHLTMNRSLSFVLELADEKGVYPTFYQRRDAGLIFADGDPWDRLREAADALLFGPAKVEIRFAALSTEGRGLPSYGECTLIPAERFVSHRTSFSEENSALRLQTLGLSARGQPLFRPDELATWSERSRLSVAKVANQITPATPDSEFPSLVLKAGITTAHDDFVEGHIYGPLTVRSFSSISLPQAPKQYKKSVIKGLAEKLRKRNIDTTAT